MSTGHVMNWVRDFLNTPTGKWTGVAVVVVAGLALWFMTRDPSALADHSGDGEQWFICTETRRTFRAPVTETTRIPIASPYSGKATGVPAEACFWTADGKTKSEPTWLALNRHLGKPEPTFCPDCGRLVEERNPPTGPQAPPTKAEYDASRPTR